MKKKQVDQFNKMLRILRRISKDYKTPEQIQRDKSMGLDYEEYLEYAYENIQSEAKSACKGIRELKVNP